MAEIIENSEMEESYKMELESERRVGVLLLKQALEKRQKSATECMERGK